MIDLQHLIDKARWVWTQTLAIHRRAPETRIASSLSAIELFVALYYGGFLKYKSSDPDWEGRDRLIVSKGHGSISLYPILADLGYFPKEELLKVCKKGSFLGGIPDPVIPGYETINGSLGHGLGVGVGIAMGLKTKKSASKVYVLVGDGELHEGANWEAIMFATQWKLDNLCVIVDNNNISMLGYTKDIIDHGDLNKRFSAFGWDCHNINGHDMKSICESYQNHFTKSCSMPKVIIAKTLKGHGVPGLENQPLSHIINPKPELIDSLLGDA